MIYRIFLDTNIFLDHLLRRNEDSVKIIGLCEKKIVTGCASSASFYTLAYLIKSLIKQSPQPFLQEYSSFIETIPTHQENLSDAFVSGFKDLEDAFQYFTALNKNDLHYLVTNNAKDFKMAKPELPVLTSKDFITLFNQ